MSTQITTAKDEETEWDGDLDADLYTVLGLGHVSYNATPAQIKSVCLFIFLIVIIISVRFENYIESRGSEY